MNENMEPRMITVDGVEHDIATLPEGVRNAIELYENLKVKAQGQQTDLLVTQLAMQQIGSQIALAIQQANTPEPEAAE